ncbi:MAG: chromate efflux transporter [Geminicoccaceae bacterium]|nr:MAG: chromate efflux transporter [Geminicoccaceae bacterium]
MGKDARAPRGGTTEPGSPGEVFRAFLKLGLTSFGGPVAHIGYFRDEFVQRRRWFDERAYGDLVALCQFLPGPASSQVGMAIGLSRAGFAGAAAAWTAFTLPSALLLVLFAFGVAATGDIAEAGWLRGLKIVAVAVVAQAVLGMARSLCPDRERATFAVVAAAIVLFQPTAFGQVGAIVLGGLAGLLLLGRDGGDGRAYFAVPVSHGTANLALAAFFLLLIGLPFLAAASGSMTLALIDGFYRAGSLVFGGGHVVLPLLQAEVVTPGWVDRDDFVAGYGAAQAVPGPLFTFAAYLGAVMQVPPTGVAGAVIALLAIFLPSFLLVVGTLPHWDALRARPQAQSVLKGVNAAVVGILLAALYDPVWTTGIHVPADFALATAAFLLLTMWQTPPWLVVILTSAGGAALTATGW